MKKIKLITPYTGAKTNLAFTNNKSGVYLVYPIGSQKAVYIGMSGTNLYKTITRHFQSWNDPRQIRITYPQQGYNIRIVLCTPLQAAKLEKALIVKHKPKDNPNKYETYTLIKSDLEILNYYTDTSAGDAPF